MKSQQTGQGARRDGGAWRSRVRHGTDPCVGRPSRGGRKPSVRVPQPPGTSGRHLVVVAEAGGRLAVHKGSPCPQTRPGAVTLEPLTFSVKPSGLRAH